MYLLKANLIGYIEYPKESLKKPLIKQVTVQGHRIQLEWLFSQFFFCTFTYAYLPISKNNWDSIKHVILCCFVCLFLKDGWSFHINTCSSLSFFEQLQSRTVVPYFIQLLLYLGIFIFFSFFLYFNKAVVNIFE